MSSFELTFTQCKQIIENGADLREFLEQVNDQPPFLEFMGAIDSISEIQAILQGGCASGAYMPAVTYSTSLECMAQCSDSVEKQLAEMDLEFSFNPANDSFSGFCVDLCSAAVEAWCYQFADILDGVDWD